MYVQKSDYLKGPRKVTIKGTFEKFGLAFRRGERRLFAVVAFGCFIFFLFFILPCYPTRAASIALQSPCRGDEQHVHELRQGLYSLSRVRAPVCC